jgi:hypothetical protein
VKALLTGTPLQEWMNEHLLDTDDNLLYKKAAVSQACFVRDRIHPLCAIEVEVGDGWSARYDWLQAHSVEVISTHSSKSVKLPVYLIEVPGLRLIMRNNFYDWKVSIESDVPVADVFNGLVRAGEEVPAVYCEGFDSQWVYGPYTPGAQQFTVELPSDFELWAFLHLLVKSTSPRSRR